MKTSAIVDINQFDKIFKINLLNIPNQTFTTTLNNTPYTITIATSLSLQSFISIKERDKVICQNGNIKDMADLTMAYAKGSFFFSVDVDKEYINLNYQNFNKGLTLYYGSF